jgi:hypothetical protein
MRSVISLIKLIRNYCIVKEYDIDFKNRSTWTLQIWIFCWRNFILIFDNRMGNYTPRVVFFVLWKKNTERFLGSHLQCCLHATVLLTVKYSAELNNYVLCCRLFMCWAFRERPFNLKRGGFLKKYSYSQYCWKKYSDFGGGKKNNLIQSFCHIS